jgi:hypothetical protein
VLATQSQISKGEKKQAIYNLFAAYLHTVPLEELLERVESGRRDAHLRHVVIYGATCSFCLSRAKRLDGSYLRTFALELKEQLAQTLTAFDSSILAGPRGWLDALLLQIISKIVESAQIELQEYTHPSSAETDGSSDIP